MLIRVNAKNPTGFSPEVGEFDVIKKVLTLWYSVAYMLNDSKSIVIKEFEWPDTVKSLRLMDLGSNEILLVPISEFKNSYVAGEGYKFNYEDWKRKYMKRF